MRKSNSDYYCEMRDQEELLVDLLEKAYWGDNPSYLIYESRKIYDYNKPYYEEFEYIRKFLLDINYYFLTFGGYCDSYLKSAEDALCQIEKHHEFAEKQSIERVLRKIVNIFNRHQKHKKNRPYVMIPPWGGWDNR